MGVFFLKPLVFRKLLYKSFVCKCVIAMHDYRDYVRIESEIRIIYFVSFHKFIVELFKDDKLCLI